MFGLTGLFVFSVISASLVPFGLPEAAAFSFWLLGFNPWTVIIIASLGTILGATINYYLGYAGNIYLLNRFIKKKKLAKAEKVFKKYGPLVLIFSWIPFVGDPLTAVAGLLKYPIKYFLILVGAGKFLRFVALYWIFINI
ncbi:MAG: hypothetical protein CMI55_01870 [Parcubacteria group bacterium]|jgi:membrane protein YqaA with SNARE-associated domain|nr:hypothetical protein [Parcubacteria group bacterium]|tara:strand:+ start:11761 stop:12180 length:420 start_codon:yes stop_codon:yes gene_type:complete